MTEPQSVAAWERPPLALIREYVAANRIAPESNGGSGGPWLGLCSVTHGPSGIQATIRTPDGEKSYQWTWKQLEAGHEGTPVPFDRFGWWTAKDLRERAS